VLKFTPVLGILVLIGSVVQVVLGYQVAGEAGNLVAVHILIGIIGLVLVAAFAAIAFKVRSATVYSKITMTVLALIVLVQVVTGFQLLSGAETLVLSHQANAFLIVILSLLTGGITFLSSKRHGQLKT